MELKKRFHLLSLTLGILGVFLLASPLSAWAESCHHSGDLSKDKCLCQAPKEFVEGECLDPCLGGMERFGQTCVQPCLGGYERVQNGTCAPPCQSGYEHDGSGQCVLVQKQEKKVVEPVQVVEEKSKKTCPNSWEEVVNGVCLKKCSPGLERSGTKCLLPCQFGFEREEGVEQCRVKCGKGFERWKESCLAVCGENYARDDETGKCYYCPKGKK